MRVSLGRHWPPNQWLECSFHPVVFTLFNFYSVLYPPVHLHVLRTEHVSVISVEALSDCADVRLSIHPDLSENPFPLF